MQKTRFQLVRTHSRGLQREYSAQKRPFSHTTYYYSPTFCGDTVGQFHVATALPTPTKPFDNCALVAIDMPEDYAEEQALDWNEPMVVVGSDFQVFNFSVFRRLHINMERRATSPTAAKFLAAAAINAERRDSAAASSRRSSSSAGIKKINPSIYRKFGEMITPKGDDDA
uniref:Uncharacterized protein n=1 Tax=Ditylenchus dipsaci TaxID=166011 RepID=A0A915CLA3_9BILA